jgi:hypothetical protein
MTWHMIVMRGYQTDEEFKALLEYFRREYQREIADRQQASGYTLYRRKLADGDSIVLIPPEALHLVERMPKWKSSPCESTPDLAGFKAVPVL